jgi:radical SAM superfamily enzyme YgiQ (UPF0313 family)
MNRIKILYIYPYESYGTPFLLNNFIRISNFLNSKKEELKGDISEEYLDLRYEDLPKYIPKNLKIYRTRLKDLLAEIFKRYEFNLTAISCYGGYNYLNTIEIAFIIKKFINPNCFIVVGGPQATIIPEDFQPENIPEFFHKTYPKSTTPIDFLIKDEGEIPFFNLIKDFLNNSLTKRENLSVPFTIKNTEILLNLDDLPIINLSLYVKYKDILNKNDRIFLEFSRGCPFRCNFCPNSENYLEGYKRLRLKSVNKCIQELKAIKNTKWLKIKQVEISDMIFLPKKSMRKQFFNEMEKIYQNEGGFPFQLRVETRVDTCSIDDLKYYKKYNIFLRIGLESSSKTLLYRMGKVYSSSKKQTKKKIKLYLKRFKKIIIEANKIDLPISYYILMGVPGEDRKTIKENRDFFLKSKCFLKKSLAEKYFINLRFNKFLAFAGSEVYNRAKEKYGATIHFKKWWRIFDEKQPSYAMIIDPSDDLSFLDSLSLNFEFIKEIIKVQNKLRNPFYSIFRWLSFKKQNFINYNLYKKLLLKK